MSEDKSLKIFSKILAFGKELNDTFGNKYNNVRLYYKLLKKTPVANKSAISKHNYIFENFYNSNKQFVISKSIKELVFDNITFSDKVFINIKQLMNETDKETRETIFKHLQLISYMITGDKEIKESLTGTSIAALDDKDNESEFISGFMSKVEGAFRDKNYDNPLTATMDLLQSGIFTDVVNTMSKDLSSGKLNINKLLGNVQGMVKDLSKDISPDVDPTGFIPNILNSTLNASSPEELINNTQSQGLNNGMPDMGGIMNMVSGLMGGMSNGGNKSGNPMLDLGSLLGGMGLGMNKTSGTNSEDLSDEELLKMLKESDTGYKNKK